MSSKNDSSAEKASLFAQTIIGVRTKNLSFCLERIKNYFYDAQAMVVTINPAKQGGSQPMIITKQTLASGISQMSGLIDKNAAAEVEEFYQNLPAFMPPDHRVTAASSLDLQKVIIENKLQKGDVIALIFIGGLGQDIQRAIAGLRKRILLAPFVLGYYPKFSGRGPRPWPWIFPWFLTTQNLGFLEGEINKYFGERKLPTVPAITLMNDLNEEQKKHRLMPTIPPKLGVEWGSGIY